MQNFWNSQLVFMKVKSHCPTDMFNVFLLSLFIISLIMCMCVDVQMSERPVLTRGLGISPELE